jgi:uncharacterized protein
MSLYDIGERAFLEGYDGIAIDEVHYARDWSISLKALCDAYPEKSICASDSSSILLRTGLADLSRRFVQIPIHLLSFREFVFLKTGKLFPVIEAFRPKLSLASEILRQIPVARLFKEFLKSGTRPIFVEGQYQERMLNIIEKTIFSDVPFFVPSIVDNNFRLLNAIIGYLAQSKVPRLTVRSLCSEWGIGAEKLYKLLFVMESVGLIRIIRREKDFRANSTGEKILFHDPSMYEVLKGDLGNVRESFVAASFLDAGHSLFAARDEREGDFIVDGTSIEVGGKGKSAKQADFVIRDDLDLPGRKVIPLWLLGFIR